MLSLDAYIKEEDNFYGQLLDDMMNDRLVDEDKFDHLQSLL